MGEEDFKDGTKDINYVSGKPPLFQMPPYEIKDGESHVMTGE